jgi:hypothetical protein
MTARIEITNVTMSTINFGAYKGKLLAEVPDDYLRDVSTLLRREAEMLSAELGRRDNEAREDAKLAVLENLPPKPMSSKKRTRGPRLGGMSTRARVKKLVWGTV